MKWVVNKIGVEQVWYSGDVIEKIKELCKEYRHNKPRLLCDIDNFVGTIEDLIESEDKE